MYITVIDTNGHKISASPFFVFYQLLLLIDGTLMETKNYQYEDVKGKKYRIEPNNKR